MVVSRGHAANTKLQVPLRLAGCNPGTHLDTWASIDDAADTTSSPRGGMHDFQRIVPSLDRASPSQNVFHSYVQG